MVKISIADRPWYAVRRGGASAAEVERVVPNALQHFAIHSTLKKLAGDSEFHLH